MGPLIKFSPRLILRIENESKAQDVLDLYLRNKKEFELFEPTRPDNFYTKEYHQAMLRREYKAYSLGTFIRYYIYLNGGSSKIIGSINFNFYRGDAIPYAEIGYKIDAAYQNQGFGYEACKAALDVIKKDYDYKQIDARIHPDNIASIKLASKLGFKPVRIELQSANIMGKYVDLMRYSLSTSDIQ